MESISMLAWAENDRVRLARSQAVRRRRRARFLLFGVHVFLVCKLKFLDGINHHAVVKIFATQMGITSGQLDFENTIFNGQNRHIESATTQIENKNVALTNNL
jgi:NAD-specific glutamate dehydrogenase